jgi:Calcineurin-like phosphoesterase
MEVLKKRLAYASLAAIIALSGITSGCGSDSTTQSAAATTTADQTAAAQTQLIFTSDAHYGIKRSAAGIFNGYSSGFQVNGAMVSVMNTISDVSTPCNDGGLNACLKVGPVDFVVEGGDIANRSEGATGKQSASTSWAQFRSDYIDGLTLRDKTGKQSPLFIIPGNHDVSNAIGYYKAPMNAADGSGLDATSYTQIYNLMMKPATPLTNSVFVGASPSFAIAATSYAATANRVLYSKDINGVHFIFITMWPDKPARDWIDTDLAKVSATTPVILFTHDQPDIETKHLTNPNGVKDINSTDKFENLVSEISVSTAITGDSFAAQRALVAWLKTHKNIVAYFHGNDHINNTYTYTGPDNDISLNVVRVDSPMKGILPDGSNGSNVNPSLLAFKVVTVDAASRKLTVRDYLWNARRWGATTNISLSPRAL